MELTGKQRRYLRSLVNTEKPVVSIGTQGVTDNIVEEVKLALFKHELIKIKVSGQDDRSKKKEFSAELAERCDAHEVQILGNTIVLYKENPEVKAIRLPKSRG